MFLRSLKEAAEDRAEERKKRKIEKEKMKRRSRKYGQAQLKHSRRGIKSCFLAVCALFILVLIFSVSYITRGDVNILIGLCGILVVVLAAAGLKSGIQGLKEREKNYITCKVGIGLNGIFLLGMAGIFIRGLF